MEYSMKEMSIENLDLIAQGGMGKSMFFFLCCV